MPTKTLKLTLKKKWFDLIKSGLKTEEYRDIKPYWDKRLMSGQTFDKVSFKNGYSQSAPTFEIELKGIRCGIGRPEWGAPQDKPVYILQLGQLLEVIQ